MPKYTSLLPEIHDAILHQLPLQDAMSLHEAIPLAAHREHIRRRITRLQNLRDAWVNATQPSLRSYSNPYHLTTRHSRRQCSVRAFLRLTVLPLSGAGLTSLAGVSEMRQLTLLDVSRNEIESVPDELVLCSALRVLHFGWNRLRRFPDVVLGLPRLTTLLLHHNRITCLPDDWSSLPNLYRLGLYACDIYRVPEQLCELLGTQTEHRRARSANLSGNRLEQHVLQAMFHRYPAMMNAVMI